MYKKTIQKALLLPLIVTAILVLSLFSSLLYTSQQAITQENYHQTLSLIEQEFARHIDTEANALTSYEQLIAHSPETIAALKGKSRTLLLSRWADTFKHLNTHRGVTHFYFSRP